MRTTRVIGISAQRKMIEDVLCVGLKPLCLS